MKIIEVTNKEQLDALYNQSALSWEGLASDQENLKSVETWLMEHDALMKEELIAHIIKGKLMNEMYGLTGNNAYADELTIVSFTNVNQMKVAIPRFEVSGRWFDDIVDNNASRERQK